MRQSTKPIHGVWNSYATERSFYFKVNDVAPLQDIPARRNLCNIVKYASKFGLNYYIILYLCSSPKLLHYFGLNRP